jgi:hypothetical protein
MRKLFGILALTAVFGTAVAQEGGNFQVAAILGNNPMFNQNVNVPLPTYGGDDTGLNNAPEYYLRLNGNSSTSGLNTITNMAGVQLAYFLGPVDVNLMYAADLSITPKKDFARTIDYELYTEQERQSDVYDLFRRPNQREIQGSYKSNWYLNVGGNFHVENKRASGYAGVRLGYKKSRYQTFDPYTKTLDEQLEEPYVNDETNEILNIAVYNRNTREGKITAYQAAIVAGAECVSNCGFVFGVEFLPFSYQYSEIEIDPNGQYDYTCGHRDIKIFSTPTLKLGVRF